MQDAKPIQSRKSAARRALAPYDPARWVLIVCFTLVLPTGLAQDLSTDTHGDPEHGRGEASPHSSPHSPANAVDGCRGEACLTRSDPTPPPPLEPRRLHWSWLSASLTVGTALAATLVGLEAWSVEDRLHADLRRAEWEPVAGSEVKARAARADTHARWSNGLWGATAALAVTTGVLVYLEYLKPAGEQDRWPRVVVTPAPALDGASLGAVLRF